MDRKNSICKFIFDIFLPNSCPCCGKILKWDKLICKSCEEKLPFINVEVCKICGKPECENHNELFYDGVFSVMFFEGLCKDMIYKLKHSGQANNFAEYSAEKLCDKISLTDTAGKIDLITCVPMNFTKRFKRGYNQSQLIAKYVARYLDKKSDYSLLLHKKDMLEQHKLKGSDRKAHAEKSFEINPLHNDIKGKTVLICDDVLTTGSTMNTCAKLLKEIGAKEVYCATISITKFKAENK